MGMRWSPTATARRPLDALLRDDGRFDLLLTDIKMPMMDGIALALAASRDYPALPILLMTGYADQRERASGLELLIRDVIREAVHAGNDLRRGPRRAIRAADALRSSLR
jgi:two-component system, cell cycle response regulator CpdR